MEFLSFGILVVQFCNKIHGLLRFKFPKLTYRKRIGSYLPLLWDPYVSDPMFMCKASAPHAIEKETMFENKFSMLFIIFWKKKKRLKISVYKLASVCYSFFRHYKIDRLFFFKLQDYTADGNTRKKNYQCINTVLQIFIRNYWKLI